jgi:hypothetical protein
VNEEALAHWVLLRQIEKNIVLKIVINIIQKVTMLK